VSGDGGDLPDRGQAADARSASVVPNLGRTQGFPPAALAIARMPALIASGRAGLGRRDERQVTPRPPAAAWPSRFES